MIVPLELTEADLDALERAGLMIDGETDPAEIGFGVRAILDDWVADGMTKKTVTGNAGRRRAV